MQTFETSQLLDLDAPYDDTIKTRIEELSATCIADGLKHDQKPSATEKAEAIPRRRHLEKVAIDYLLDDLNAYVAAIGGAVLYAYDDGIVVDYKNENENPWFEENGFTAGLNLGNSTLGPTAFELTRAGLPEAWMRGKNHYLDLLKPFASYCTKVEDEDGALFTFILVPDEKFSSETIRFFQVSISSTI